MFTAVGKVEKVIEKEKNGVKYYVSVVNFGGEEKAMSFSDKKLETGIEYLFIITTDNRGLKVSPVCRAK